MKSKSILAVASLLLCGVVWLSACSQRSSQETLSELRKGMTVEQVKSALGRPSTDKPLGENKRAYVYKATDGYVVVFFVNGKVDGFNRSDKVMFR